MEAENILNLSLFSLSVLCFKSVCIYYISKNDGCMVTVRLGGIFTGGGFLGGGGGGGG